MIIGKDKDGIFFIGGNHRKNREVWVKFKTKQDTEYYVILKNNWLHPKLNKKYGLGMYGPGKVDFEKIIHGDGPRDFSVTNLIKEALITKVHQDSNTHYRLLESSEEWKDVYTYMEMRNFGYGYYYFKNDTNENLTAIIEKRDDLCAKFSNF